MRNKSRQRNESSGSQTEQMDPGGPIERKGARKEGGGVYPDQTNNSSMSQKEVLRSKRTHKGVYPDQTNNSSMSQKEVLRSKRTHRIAKGR
jgi:hypothetical protein